MRPLPPEAGSPGYKTGSSSATDGRRPPGSLTSVHTNRTPVPKTGHIEGRDPRVETISQNLILSSTPIGKRENRGLDPGTSETRLPPTLDPWGTKESVVEPERDLPRLPYPSSEVYTDWGLDLRRLRKSPSYGSIDKNPPIPRPIPTPSRPDPTGTGPR